MPNLCDCNSTNIGYDSEWLYPHIYHPIHIFRASICGYPPHPVTLYWAPSSALVLFLKISSIPSLSCWYCNFDIFWWFLMVLGQFLVVKPIPPKRYRGLVRQALLCPKPGCLLLKKPGRPGTCFFWCPKMGCFSSATHVFYMDFINKNLGWIYKNRRLTQQH